MKVEKQLIVFAEDWGRFPSSTQFLISALLKMGWSVVWINSIGMSKIRFSLPYLRRVVNKIYQYVLGKTRVVQHSLPENLTVINPMVIPIIGNSIINHINNFILKKQLSGILKTKNFNRPILWMTLPTAYPYHTIFNTAPLVYYCCDDYTVLGDAPFQQITDLETKIIKKATLIIVVSDVLAAKMPANKTLYLDHGIDLPLFLKHYPRPDDLPRGKPIAGFYGTIANWMDLDLLYQCVSQLHDFNFVFIGPATVNLVQLQALDNFFYLGSKSYQEIPAYSQHWDVGLIPFIKNQLIKAFNPLKLKEYLAHGKPVVAIDLAIFQPYKDYIYIAKNQEEFVNMIFLAVNKGHSKKTFDISSHGWDSRATLLEKKLLQLRPIVNRPYKGSRH